ncbi:MAG TPA: hypothetical protein VJN94_17610 [Candidatus Binataceae bacterium]|nr:hypothetical protein [Candidatus Binataceae bacterium]
MNRNLREFIQQYVAATEGTNPVVRCGVCDSLTALYQVDDAGRPICPRHGSGDSSDKLLMEADAHLMLGHFFQPDMDNPQ